MATKRRTLDLEQRVHVIELAEKEKLSARKIAAKLGVGKSQIQTILKQREELKREFEVSGCRNRKRKMKRTANEAVNDLMWDLFQLADMKNIAISGPLLREKAREAALRLGIPDFKASNGWLETFRLRNGISFSKSSREARWTLPKSLSEFLPGDVFYLDETGLMFRALPTDSVPERVSSTERLTVMLCCNATGEKVLPLVIARDGKCFQKFDVSKLPVTFKTNRKAWMTLDIMKEWLVNLNDLMQRQGRKIVLFQDNCFCHPSFRLSNVHIEKLPDKYKSAFERLFLSFKMNYRKQVLRWVLTVSEAPAYVVRSVSVSQAVRWIDDAWKSVDAATIGLCFQVAGFVRDDFADERASELQDLLEKAGIPAINVLDYCNMDRDVTTCQPVSSADDLLQCLLEERGVRTGSSAADEEREIKTEPVEVPVINTYAAALNTVKELEKFALHVNDAEVLNLVGNLQTVLEKRFS